MMQTVIQTSRFSVCAAAAALVFLLPVVPAAAQGGNGGALGKALTDAKSHAAAKPAIKDVIDTTPPPVVPQGDMLDRIIVVVNDGSRDNTAQVVAGLCESNPALRFVNFTDVTAVEPMADGTLRVERVVPEGVQVLAVQTPAVIAVATDAAVPRVPGMKDVLAAGRKPVEKLDLAALGVEPTELTALAGTVRARAQAERAVRKQHVIDTADPAVAAAELVDTLREAGVW